MVPDVALVAVKARVMLVFEPAVTDDGVAARVAVGTGVGVTLLLEEEEPPQPVKARLRNSKKARGEGWSARVSLTRECDLRRRFLAPLVKTRRFGMTPSSPWHSRGQAAQLPVWWRLPLAVKLLKIAAALTVVPRIVRVVALRGMPNLA